MGDTEVVKGLFDVITSNIFLIIYLFAAVELYLSLSVFYLLRRQTVRLNDATDNMIKGFTDAKGGKLEIAHLETKITHAERGDLVTVRRDLIHRLG